MTDQDLVFWGFCVTAVILIGISKGGFGGLGILAVPLMSLVMPPLQAAGIILPVLIVMDWVGVAAYRKHWDFGLLQDVLPGALIGILLAYFLAGYVSEVAVKIAIGLIAVTFPLYMSLKRNRGEAVAQRSRLLGTLSGLVSGFASFIAHAGGPPFQAYAIPQKLNKQVYAGTSVMFFTIINGVKLVPYSMLGQFDRANLFVSFALMPIAPIGVLVGVYLVKRVDQTLFYRLLYALIFIVGGKLLWDGLVEVWA